MSREIYHRCKPPNGGNHICEHNDVFAQADNSSIAFLVCFFTLIPTEVSSRLHNQYFVLSYSTDVATAVSNLVGIPVQSSITVSVT